LTGRAGSVTNGEMEKLNLPKLSTEETRRWFAGRKFATATAANKALYREFVGRRYVSYVRMATLLAWGAIDKPNSRQVALAKLGQRVQERRRAAARRRPRV
jgi:hypothetical protein